MVQEAWLCPSPEGTLGTGELAGTELLHMAPSLGCSSCLPQGDIQTRAYPDLQEEETSSAGPGTRPLPQGRGAQLTRVFLVRVWERRGEESVGEGASEDGKRAGLGERGGGAMEAKIPKGGTLHLAHEGWVWRKPGWAVWK